jgi:hypothetical protein
MLAELNLLHIYLHEYDANMSAYAIPAIARHYFETSTNGTTAKAYMGPIIRGLTIGGGGFIPFSRPDCTLGQRLRQGLVERRSVRAHHYLAEALFPPFR